MSYRVEELRCVGPPPLAVGDVIVERAGTDACGIPLLFERDGGLGPFGVMHLQDNRALTARIELLGGACLVREVLEGSTRLIFACPRCHVAVGL